MSDVLEIPCGGCGRALRVAPDHAGKMARCPVCGHITHVPATLAPASGQRELAGDEAPPKDTDTNPLGGVGRPAPNTMTPAPGTMTPAPNTMSAAASVNPSSASLRRPLAGEGQDKPLAGKSSPAPPLGFGGQNPEWYMKTPEEQTFGPATFLDLERWVQEGRVTSDCHLCQSATGTWQPADWLFPSLKTQPSFSPLLTSPTPGARYSPPAHTPSHYPPPGGSTYAPASLAPGNRYVAAHRGALILILGLMGLVIHCPLFPFMSWVMGSNDMREMEAGRMDPQGRDLTRAGMIIGMILSILWILGFVVFFVVMLISAAGS